MTHPASERHRQPSMIALAGHLMLEDLRQTRRSIDAGVRWFGRGIQCDGAHLTLFVIIPVLAVYMSRGLPTFYLAVFYFSVMAHRAEVALGMEARHPWRDLWHAFRRPLLLLTILLCAYALVSCIWSPDLDNAIDEGTRFLGGLVLMVPFIWLLPGRSRWWHYYLPALGLVGAAAILLVEFSPVHLLREMIYGPNAAFMNRSVIIVSFMIWAALSAAGGRVVWLQRTLMVVLVAAAVFTSESQASMLAFLVGGVAALVSLVLPRVVAWLIGIGTVAAFTAAPLVAPHLDRIFYLLGLERYLDASNLRRIEIWQAFSDVVWQHPVFGWGIKASHEFGLQPVSDVTWMVGPTHHPHNALIQTWVELGAVGVVMILAIVILLAYNTLRLPAERRPFGFGALAAGLTIAAVSHGMWQSWWICLILATIAIFAMEDDVADAPVGARSTTPAGGTRTGNG